MDNIPSYINLVKKTKCPRLKQLFNYKDINVDKTCGTLYLCSDCISIAHISYKDHCSVLNYFYKHGYKKS